MAKPWHLFVDGGVYNRDEIVAACEMRLRSGRVKTPAGEEPYLEVIRRCPHDRLVWNPGRSFRRVPWNPNAWLTETGEAIWERHRIHVAKGHSPIVLAEEIGWEDKRELLAATETREQIESDLADEVAASRALSNSARATRLADAAKVPERILIISGGFRRNPDVIVTVLLRANGVCEKCKANAPFLRRSDGSPYLEVHHWVPLSQGGEDTVKNSAALCPNCHREVHHA